MQGFRQSVLPWLLPLAVAGGILVWNFLILRVVGNKPRDWAYGTLPYVPGEYYSSTEQPGRGTVPTQVPLPPLRSKETP
jgi:hypothetical protein